MLAVLEHPRRSQNLGSIPLYRVRPHGPLASIVTQWVALVLTEE
jgi:hypothetical protein